MRLLMLSVGLIVLSCSGCKEKDLSQYERFLEDKERVYGHAKFYSYAKGDYGLCVYEFSLGGRLYEGATSIPRGELRGCTRGKVLSVNYSKGNPRLNSLHEPEVVLKNKKEEAEDKSGWFIMVVMMLVMLFFPVYGYLVSRGESK